MRTLVRPPLLPGLALVALGLLLFAALVVLAPLRLDRLGWGATAIGVVFLLAALAEAAVHPLLGRWSDTSGPAAPVRAGLIASVTVLLALTLTDGNPWLLALFVVLGGACFNATVTPGAAAFSAHAEQAEVGPGAAYGAVSLAWSIGYAAGASLAGAIAGALGPQAVYLALATMCVLVLFLTRQHPRRAARR